MEKPSAGDAGSHPRSRYLGLVAVALILLIGTIALPLISGASTYRGGITVNTSGARVDGNMYVASLRSRIDTDVAGDLTLAAFTSSVYGNVGGSLHLLAGRTSVYGNVAGSVYVAGGNVDIRGSIDGDVVVAAGRVELRDGSRVTGDVIVLAGQLGSRGTIDGTLYASSLLLDQSGTVNGDLQVQADRLSIDRGATVGGTLRYQSPTDADIAADATVRGETERTNATPWTGVGAGALAPFGTLLKIVWALVTATVLIAIAPRLMYRFAEIASPVVQPAILGAIGLVALPVFAVIAMVSVLGLPIGVLLLLGYLVALYLSQVVVGLALGRFLLPRRWRDGSRGFLLLAATLGLILIGVLRLLPFPYVNIVVTVAVTLLGFGAIISIVLDLTSDRLRASRRRFA